jgi:hypothetical protein
MFHLSEDGAERKIDNLTNFALVHPTGANFRSTKLASGAITVMVWPFFWINPPTQFSNSIVLPL